MSLGRVEATSTAATTPEHTASPGGNGRLTGAEETAFRACCRQLESPTPGTRRRAVEHLGDFGPAASGALRRALIDLDPEVQVIAVESIVRIGGSEGYQLLLEALRSDAFKVRVAAARALGEVGRADAIGPLTAAYHRCFTGRSVRLQRLVVPVILILIGALLGAIAWSGAHNRVAVIPLFQVLAYLIGFLAIKRHRNVPETFLSAVLKVAERTPDPGIKVLLPDLRAVASDRFQYGRAARMASLDAVERIESLTAAFHDLPVPATAPQQNADTLPVPVGGDGAGTRAGTGGGE